MTGWAVRAGLRGLAAAALLGGLTAAAAPVGAHAGERRAGTVLAVDVQARTLTVDEYRANGERRALRVQVPENALMLQSERNAAGRDVTDAFRNKSITLADVRTGDFVVIELSEHPDVARLVMVTWRRGAGSGAPPGPGAHARRPNVLADPLNGQAAKMSWFVSPLTRLLVGGA